MNKKLLSLFLVLTLMFTALVPFVNAQTVTMYASDGRTEEVNSDEIELWKNVGWYETPEEASLITMYASDGRSILVPKVHREAYLNVGWYNTAEDAQIITMYSMDGRTIEIPQYYRQAYRNVGWYDTKEEVVITMYSMDGRSIEVPRDQRDDYKNVGWYDNREEVFTTMYSMDGRTIEIPRSQQEDYRKVGWYDNQSDVSQLMFSADGRFIYVPFDDVAAYNAVGWYTAGGKLDPSRPMVAITYDDGPGRYTDRILSILEKYNARATFFVQGQNVSGYKDALVRAVEIGCEIGNHTWSHVNLASSSGGTISSQISATNTAVYNATGKYPKLYRPPYGAYNSYVLNSIAMPAIMWDVDTLDWKTRSAYKTLLSVQNDTRDGSIILMHDIHSPTADAAESVIRHLLMQGYQLVTVSELLECRKGGAVGGRVYNSAR